MMVMKFGRENFSAKKFATIFYMPSTLFQRLIFLQNRTWNSHKSCSVKKDKLRVYSAVKQKYQLLEIILRLEILFITTFVRISCTILEKNRSLNLYKNGRKIIGFLEKKTFFFIFRNFHIFVLKTTYFLGILIPFIQISTIIFQHFYFFTPIYFYTLIFLFLLHFFTPKILLC